MYSVVIQQRRGRGGATAPPPTLGGQKIVQFSSRGKMFVQKCKFGAETTPLWGNLGAKFKC